jgi:hypothetical protein
VSIHSRIVFAGLFLTLAFASPLRGEGALAVAIPDTGLSKGFTYGMHVNAATAEDARKEAMTACQESVKKMLEGEKKSKTPPGRCRVVESFKKSCVAVALDAKGQWAGWAVFKEEKKARDRAVLRCKDGGLACAVAEAQCDK